MKNILNFKITNNIERKKIMSKNYGNLGFWAPIPPLKFLNNCLILVFVICVLKDIRDSID